MKKLSPHMVTVLRIGHPIITVITAIFMIISMTFVVITVRVMPVATCQLESKKQCYYPKKEFLFIHSNHPLLACLNLIIGLGEFKLLDGYIDSPLHQGEERA